MLITDGAMEDFQDVFKEFNWPERRVWPKRTHSPYTVFNYTRLFLVTYIKLYTLFVVVPGSSIHLSDWTRDDICRKPEMDRLQ